MKIRIVEVKPSGGGKFYIVEKRKFFFWWVKIKNPLFSSVSPNGKRCITIFSTYAEARTAVDQFIKTKEEKDAKETVWEGKV